MKRKFIVFTLLTVLILVACAAVFVGCDNADKVEYSVTVLNPDGTPLEDVTVKWSANKSNGSAVTNMVGKATVSLAPATYAVSLENIPENLTYTSVSVSSEMRNVTIKLASKRVNYSATVIDKAGQPAQNVTVNWLKGSALAGTATTDAQGVATVELNYDTYSVSVMSLPSGNIYSGTLSATGTNPSVQFTLSNGETQTYTVTVKSKGGLLFKEKFVTFYDENDMLITSGNTDENGVISVSLVPANYTAEVELNDFPAGYTFEVAVLSATEFSDEIILTSSVVMDKPAQNLRYVMGDIIHNYTFTTPYEVNGSKKTYTIAELLQTKKAIIINNWGTNCTYCVQEMPAMQEAYETYGDDIEILAVSNYSGGDSDSAIVSYYERYGYTFPMMRDYNGFASKFGISGWPTTVVIDRYGAIARIEVGAISSAEVWGRLLDKYVGNDYVQTFIPGTLESDSINDEVSKPDITLDDDHYEKVAEAINNKTQFPAGASISWFGEEDDDMVWPFILGEDPLAPENKVLCASNTGKANSIAAIYATVKIPAGKVLTFDYYSDTEEDDDVLSVLWDHTIVKEISGKSTGWQTCYLTADLLDSEHTLVFAYVKDNSGSVGKDNVFIRNFRMLDTDDIAEPTDMLRPAAYGTLEEGDTIFPYYAEAALNQADGYYHINTSSLENAAFAGNDASPMLFVNLMGITKWHPIYSLAQFVLGTDESGEYVVDCRFTVNGVTKDWRNDLIEYLSTSIASEIYGMLPVDKELYDLLVVFMSRVSGDDSHPNEWLEACYFYSHYGTGEPVGNPIIGLTEKTAIEMNADEVTTADLTRYIYPFPTKIYTFTPETDGVYKFETYIKEEDGSRLASQIWLYDDASSPDKPLLYCGDTYFTREGVTDYNIVAYRYLTAGHKYYICIAFQMSELGLLDFDITNVGSSASVMSPASYDYYWQVLDDNGNLTNEVVLAGAVKYTVVDGYYHALNPDGTIGDFIYVDVINISTLGKHLSLTALVDSYVKDPSDGKNLSYKMFDFSKRIAFFETDDGLNYDPELDITEWGEQYKDYTDIIKAYIASAPTSGEYKGLVKVDQQLVDILTLYVECRNNSLTYDKDGNVSDFDEVLDNEWLRFCWYNRLYDSNNP